MNLVHDNEQGGEKKFMWGLACVARCEQCGIINDHREPHNEYWRDDDKCGKKKKHCTG